MDSRFHSENIFEDVPFKPLSERSSTLHHNRLRRRLRKTIPRILVTLLAVPFLVLPIVAWTVHGSHVVLYSRGYYVQKVTEVAPTVFPMVFAAVLGMFLKALAMRLAEKGCKLGTLEQLIGTSTTSSAVILPFTLQTFNTLTIILFLLFALSPLGSQATLRILSETNSTTYLAQNISVLNPFGVSSSFAGRGAFVSTLQTDGIYTASLLAPKDIKQSSVDIWGNVKIPDIEYLENNTSIFSNDQDGWYRIRKDWGHYSSLIGWPISLFDPNSTSTFSPPVRLTDTNFTIETGYWHVNCTSLSMVVPDPCKAVDMGVKPVIQGSNFASQCFNTTSWDEDVYFPGGGKCAGECLNLGYNQSYIRDNKTSINPLPLVALWSKEIGNDITVGECYLYQTFVEVNITCAGSDCWASGLRRLNPDFFRNSNRANVTNILSGNKSVLDNMLVYWKTAMEDVRSTGKNGNSLYMLNPPDPYSGLNSNMAQTTTANAMLNVGAEEFGNRLTSLLNTYYQGSGSAFINPERSPRSGFQFIGVNKTISMAQYTNIYDVSTLWASITFGASIMLFFFGVVSVVWAFTSMMPEMFGVGMFTSLLAESRHVRGMETESEISSRSLRDSDEKAVLLKNRMVKIGDVRGDGDVGYISFGMSEAEFKRDKEEKRRLRSAVVSLNTKRVYG